MFTPLTRTLKLGLTVCGGTALPIDAPTLAGTEPTALEIQSNGRQ